MSICTAFKNFFRLVVILAVIVITLLAALITFFQLKELTELGFSVLNIIKSNGFEGAGVKHFVGIFAALLLAAMYLIITQFFLSLYKVSIKNEMDEVAKRIVEKFIGRYGK